MLVSRADQNSLAAQQLLIGDHIIDIDGRPVTDKDVCRELLLKSLQAQRFVTMVVERPETMEARHWVQSALAASAAQAPSVAMNSDVREIAARERQKLKKTQPVVTPFILYCNQFTHKCLAIIHLFLLIYLKMTFSALTTESIKSSNNLKHSST